MLERIPERVDLPGGWLERIPERVDLPVDLERIPRRVDLPGLGLERIPGRVDLPGERCTSGGREWRRGGNQPTEASPSNKNYRKSQEVLLRAQNTAVEEQVDEHATAKDTNPTKEYTHYKGHWQGEPLTADNGQRHEGRWVKWPP